MPTRERGERRRQLILTTAAELLVEAGVEGFTTNALAARAGIAVGSVYQYYANKQAILLALGEFYLDRLGQNTLDALQLDVEGLTIAEMVDRAIQPMIAFQRDNPAFALLDASAEAGAALSRSAQKVDADVLATIQNLYLRIRPDLHPARSRQIARVTKALYKGMSYLLQHQKEVSEEGGNVDDMLDEITTVIKRYLESELGTDR